MNGMDFGEEEPLPYQWWINSLLKDCFNEHSSDEQVMVLKTLFQKLRKDVKLKFFLEIDDLSEMYNDEIARFSRLYENKEGDGDDEETFAARNCPLISVNLEKHKSEAVIIDEMEVTARYLTVPHLEFAVLQKKSIPRNMRKDRLIQEIKRLYPSEAELLAVYNDNHVTDGNIREKANSFFADKEKKRTFDSMSRG